MIARFWPKYLPLALLVLLVAAVVFPLIFSDPFITSIAVLTLIYAGASTSWNIFSGYTRYIALGHATFFGVGAYALAIMCERWHVTSDFGPFLLLPLCGLFAAIVAVPLGTIALRARSHTFVVITIAMIFIAQLLAYNLRDLTNGSKGFELPIPSWTFDVYNLPFYYGGLIILLLALATSWWIRNSKFGLGLLAIRDDEDRALGLGVRTGPSKLLAFVISASFVGMLGGLWGYYLESVFPQYAFSPLFDVSVALMAFLGGIGTLSGPILGALILIPAQQYFASDATLSPYYLVLYGGVFLVVILLLPEGIIPTARKRWAQWNAQRASAQPPRRCGGQRGWRPMSMLEVQGVSKAYGGIQALDACTISAEQGKITGLIGPNGSGKTTLFNVVTGYERVDGGQVVYNGKRISNSSPDKVFGLGIGRTFQLTRIFPGMTVLENMHVASPRRAGLGLLRRWSSSEEQRRAIDLLEFVSLERLQNELAANLSYGQKKLLEFASILIAEPQVILLDEPAGGVNPTMINRLAGQIRTLNQRGITFLVVEHNMEFVMGLCDTVNVMHRGATIASGSPAEVRNNPAVLEAYLGD